MNFLDTPTAHQLALLVADNSSLLLRASDNALQGISDLIFAQLLQVAASSQNGRLIHQVGQGGS